MGQPARFGLAGLGKSSWGLPGPALLALAVVAAALLVHVAAASVGAGGAGPSPSGAAAARPAADGDAPAAAQCALRPGDAGRLLAGARRLREGVLAFWLRSGLDTEHGGFHGVRRRRS